MSVTYTIPLSGLKEGRHIFDFEINKEFFEQFEESEIQEGSLTAHVEMDRRKTHLDLLIKIRGKVLVCCDRCLEMFLQPIESENRLLVKFGKDDGNRDPDILLLDPGEHELDMKQDLYEYILLALPIKKIHPIDQNGMSTCSPEMLKKLKEHMVEKEPEADPRWDELKKLMNDN
jgi:uncharacterized protein